ncbi:MAG TPA: histidine phosphatase family protein [Rhodothermales bacterium]|nr:histidine phosphatase family protein [Rhodothermales bacterium]
MRLYLMRHGIAEDRQEGLDEADRALTAKGHHKLAGQAAALRRLNWHADVLLTSPMRRATETAQVVGVVYGLVPEPVGALTSGADPDAYFAVLAVQPSEAHVWVVSHEPDLSDVIRALTGGTVKMRKGTIAVLDLDVPARDGARLRGLYDPDVLRAVADEDEVGNTARKGSPEIEGQAAPAKSLLDMPLTKGQRRPKNR